MAGCQPGRIAHGNESRDENRLRYLAVKRLNDDTTGDKRHDRIAVELSSMKDSESKILNI